MPVYGHNNESNWKSQALMLGCFGLANLLTHRFLTYIKGKKAIGKNTNYQVAFGAYSKGIDGLTRYVKSQHIFIARNLNAETRANGLVILEAYYGLDEHIY